MKWKERRKRRKLQRLKAEVIKVQMANLDKRKEEKADNKKREKEQIISQEIAFYESKAKELGVGENKKSTTEEIVNSSGSEFIR